MKARVVLLAALAIGVLGAVDAPENRLLLVNAQVITLAVGQEAPIAGYVVVDHEGRISAIGRGSPPANVKAAVVFDAGGQIAMPGFVSASSHLAGRMAHARGLARGDLYYSTLRGALEHLRGGVTTVYNDTTIGGGGRDDQYAEQVDAEFSAGGHFVLAKPASGRDLSRHERAELLLSSTARSGGNDPGASVIWSPLSSGRLGAGMADIPADLKAGMTVGMGFDGESGEDVADPFENMRVGLYGLRFRDRDPRGLQPIDMLRLHTIGAAKAIHVADKIGTLEVGKLGDVILIDPHSPDTGPVSNVYGTLVLACDRLNISSVFVAGNAVLRHGTHVLVNASDVAREARVRLAAKVKAATPAAIRPAGAQAAIDGQPLLVVKNAWLVPLDGSERPPFRGYLVVSQAGRIAALSAGDPPTGAAPVFDAGGRIVMPGFLSGHNHLAQSISRGRNPGSWVTEWGGGGGGGQPQAGDTHDFVLHGSADMITAGITTVYNYAGMGRRPETLRETLDGMLDSGGRFVYGTNLPYYHEDYTQAQLIQIMREFLAELKTHPSHDRILRVSIASQGMRWGEDASRFEFDMLKTFPELEMDMQLHYLEPPPNVPRTYYERSNFVWLKKYGVLGPNLTFAHFIHPTEVMLQEAAAAKAAMSWNPLSNGRLASGLPDIPRYRKLGLTVGMGIDGQASADIADPFQNMRVGLYGLRFEHKDPAVLSPRDMLLLHTLETARAIRVQKDVGSLEVGKYADFIVLDPSDPDTGAADDIYASLVYRFSRANVTDVFVGGKPIVRDRQFLPFDLKRFQDRVAERLKRGGGDAN